MTTAGQKALSISLTTWRPGSFLCGLTLTRVHLSTGGFAVTFMTGGRDLLIRADSSYGVVQRTLRLEWKATNLFLMYFDNSTRWIRWSLGAAVACRNRLELKSNEYVPVILHSLCAKCWRMYFSPYHHVYQSNSEMPLTTTSDCSVPAL